MENKINIAELLKDCPQGMELDCTTYDNVSFDKISDDKKATYPIFCYITDKEGNRSGISFTENGCESKRYGAKCVIFPKGKTTWEGFVPPVEFKDGDILTTILGSIFILKEPNENNYYYSCYIAFDFTSKIVENCTKFCDKKDCRNATEEEKQKFFQVIKNNGYKWNPETKSLEKLSESKKEVKDKPVIAGICFNREDYADEVELNLGNYEIKTCKGRTYAIFKNQETKTLENLTEPRFKVGNRIKHKNDEYLCTIMAIKNNLYFISYFNTNTNRYQNAGVSIEKQDDYELAPNKFDINTLVPFESKVLIRNDESQRWLPAFWGYKVVDGFITTFGWCKYCIPYEGNEFLFKTTNDCDEYYKTWEK